MTSEDANEYLPLVRALSEGRLLQIRMGDKWVDIAPGEEVNFHFAASEYRAKPREWFAVVRKNRIANASIKIAGYDSYAQAAQSINDHEDEVIRVQEVINWKKQ